MKILHLGLCCCESPENGFQAALRKVSTVFRELKPDHPNFNREAIRIATEIYSPTEPTLIFIQIQAPDILWIDTAKKLSILGFVINFTGDVRWSTPDWMLQIGKVIQLTTFSNMFDVHNCTAAGIKADFLNYAIDPKRYTRHGEVFSIPKIVAHMNNYGGGYFPLSQFRIDAVERLQKEFKEDFAVYGTGWSNAKGNLNSDQVAESKQYNNALIAISISHFDYNRYASDRLFRCLGSGIFTLSHNYDNIKADFVPGVHLDTFVTLDEMVTKCHHYLENSTERLKIAQWGFDLAHDKFTFDAMVQNILQLYEKHK